MLSNKPKKPKVESLAVAIAPDFGLLTKRLLTLLYQML
jgi:hypothetical protein